jgi:hypothetical protein
MNELLMAPSLSSLCPVSRALWDRGLGQVQTLCNVLFKNSYVATLMGWSGQWHVDYSGAVAWVVTDCPLLLIKSSPSWWELRAGQIVLVLVDAVVNQNGSVIA